MPSDNEETRPTTGGAPEPTPAAATALRTAPKHGPRSRKKLLIGGIALLVVVLFVIFGIPWLELTFSTESTDDAYVNGHVTFVASQVRGQVAKVLVDDNARVRKGDLLAELDKQPYEIAVSQAQAAVDTADADLHAATAAVRGMEAEARGRRWNLQHAIEDVDNRIALLHERVATLDKARAALKLAQVEFDRVKQLVAQSYASRELYDQRQAELTTANAGVTEALSEIYQTRVSLGLDPAPASGNLGDAPADLDQTFSAVLQAQADLIQSAAQLGVIHSYDESPKQMVADFEKQGDIDVTFAQIAANAPAVKQAEARLESARRDLAQAQLNLSYCDIVAAIDGVVTRRNVNPGNYVQVGQNLMAVRSLDEIWVDANFKETQLRDLRIGLPVDLYVDMYGGKQLFKGRIAGFTMGTGSTLALLPPENATGNFVKVVQRLPVRIELEGYDPDKDPLFIGTSVVPYVYIDKTPTGPDAGKFLQSYLPQPQAANATQSAPAANP